MGIAQIGRLVVEELAGVDHDCRNLEEEKLAFDLAVLARLVQLESGLAAEAGLCNAMAEQRRVPRARRPSRFVAAPQSDLGPTACRPAEDALMGPAIVSEQVRALGRRLARMWRKPGKLRPSYGVGDFPSYET